MDILISVNDKEIECSSIDDAERKTAVMLGRVSVSITENDSHLRFVFNADEKGFRQALQEVKSKVEDKRHRIFTAVDDGPIKH